MASQSTDPARPSASGLSPTEARDRLMLRARDAMDRNYERDLGVAALARYVGVSPAHFSRTFK